MAAACLLAVVPFVMVGVVLTVSDDRIGFAQPILQFAYGISMLAIAGYWLLVDANRRGIRPSVAWLTLASCAVMFVLPIFAYLFYSRGASRGAISSLWLVLFIGCAAAVLAIIVVVLDALSQTVSGS